MLTPLGNTGILVSRMCFGTGTTKIDCESAQSKLPVDALGSLLVQVVVMERLKPWIEHNATHPAAAAASLPEAVGAH